jgi:hypothetical protein
MNPELDPRILDAICTAQQEDIGPGDVTTSIEVGDRLL